MSVRGNDLGMSVDVAIANRGTDCTNGGVSSLPGTFVLFGRTLPFEGYMSREDAERKGYHVLYLDAGHQGIPIVTADPTPFQLSKVGGDASKLCGPVAGGNYVATTDSRFHEAAGFYGAIPLHDRYDTWADADALSR